MWIFSGGMMPILDLREIRELKQKTLIEAQELVRCSKSTISEWERLQRAVAPRHQVRASRFYKVTVAALRQHNKRVRAILRQSGTNGSRKALTTQ
jgi:transcriptional regulator with XRE-family HTH domain